MAIRRVLIPGSFDPLHLGHVDVIEQAHALFGEVVVGVLYNFTKPSGTFTPDERVEFVRATFAGVDGITAQAFGGLAVQAAAECGADAIVKGLRTSGDFEIEQQMAHMNHSVSGLQTVFVPCRADLGFVSSRFVREIAANGGDVRHLVSAPVAAALGQLD